MTDAGRKVHVHPVYVVDVGAAAIAAVRLALAAFWCETPLPGTKRLTEQTSVLTNRTSARIGDAVLVSENGNPRLWNGHTLSELLEE